MKLIIELNGHEETLEMEDAKEVYEQLARIFAPAKKEKVIVREEHHHHDDWGRYLWPYWQEPFRVTWETTTGSTLPDNQTISVTMPATPITNATAYWSSSSRNVNMRVVS